MEHDWQQWIERLKSKDLTEEELREFEAALRDDPTQADAYMDALLTEVSLESGSLPKPVMQREMLPSQVVGRQRPARRLLRVAAWAASVAVCITAAYFFGRSTAPAPVASTVLAEHVATITDADAAAEKTGIRIGAPLPIGDLEVPEHSKVGIAMRDGARLEVHGPAQLSIVSKEKIRLRKGRVSTYAPEYAHGFTVDTEDGEVIDLGTRFVTAAGAGRGTEVHVLEGLVKARPGEQTSGFQNLEGKNAAILKDGKMEPTEFLARRLDVPLDPVLPDHDGDGIPDVVESHYGTDPFVATSKPDVQRIEESFRDYQPGPIQGSKWQGNGTFLAQGLTYRNNGKSLKTSGGALQTIGQFGVGTVLVPKIDEFPTQGVIYLSFLSQNPSIGARNAPFGGLLLYKGDREELFVGKLSPVTSYGSRLKTSLTQEKFEVAADQAPHLFVIRIDRTRLVTDVFIDPPLGQPESSISHRVRYYNVPDFDRIMLRSGSASGNFPVVFDEIRAGLSWDAVLPLAQ